MGSGSHLREKEMFPQWHLPSINMRVNSLPRLRQPRQDLKQGMSLRIFYVTKTTVVIWVTRLQLLEQMLPLELKLTVRAGKTYAGSNRTDFSPVK